LAASVDENPNRAWHRIAARPDAAQQATLGTLEGFGWRLAFVRRPLFRDPVPVAFDRSGGRFVVIEADGGIDETPALRVRA
jgi:hypothetical protein